ncbi:MAG TPA: MotA/TolQ/ExbB proton channel family protein [Opitutaceae bacterium]
MNEGILEFIQPILDGGWVMIPLFALGLMVYGLGFRMILTLLPIRAGKVTDEECRRWVQDPASGPMQIGEIVRYSQNEVKSLDEIQSRFEEIRLNEIPRINININVLNILVNAAPLLGLLGTVLGMLTTFQGLAAGGSEKTTALVADGIRVALITTEMGLFLAIPGTFLVYLVKQMRNSFLRLIVRLENVTLQIYKGRFSN